MKVSRLLIVILRLVSTAVAFIAGFVLLRLGLAAVVRPSQALPAWLAWAMLVGSACPLGLGFLRVYVLWHYRDRFLRLR